MTAVMTMARKSEKSSKTGTEPAGKLPTIVTLKGRKEWAEWLESLANRARTTKSGVIDRALAELAERLGHELPPNRT